MNRKIGLEVEFSDIKVVDAARLVYDELGLDFSKWQDRWGPYNKPKLTYDRWHVMSDGSLYNSDGSRCMWSIRDSEGGLAAVNSSKASSARSLWKGAELISPATSDYEQLLYDLMILTPLMIENGAVCKKALWDSLHVHVDISDLPFEQVRMWPWKIWEVQHILDRLSTKWKKRAFFTPEDLLRMAAATSPAEFGIAYCTVDYRKKLEMKFWEFDAVRRLVDVSPYFNDRKPYSTIEFRCFSASKNVMHMWQCVELAVDLVNTWAAGGQIGTEELEMRVKEIEGSYE